MANCIDLGGWLAPDGWNVEYPEWAPSCVVIGNHEIGWATINMRNRTFCLGYGTPIAHDSFGGKDKFRRRGWNWRIMCAAEQRLRES